MRRVAHPPLTPMATLRWSIVRPILDDLAPRQVLEIGCGQGSVGARIAARSGYVGVEPDVQSCGVARARIEPLGGVVVDEVPAERRYDVVCAFEVLEHLEDDGAAIADWLRRLRPGGSIVISVPAWPHRFGAMDSYVGHVRRYLPEELDELLRHGGCGTVRHTLYGWPLGFLLEATRNGIARKRGVRRQESMAGRSAASGRVLQPNPITGLGVRLGVAPFAALQRARPTSGTGLVCVGTL
jgi:SAM-dependent methyltransferase